MKREILLERIDKAQTSHALVRLGNITNQNWPFHIVLRPYTNT